MMKEQALKATELILNKDGSIYHLNLLPEEIGNDIILVGDPDRVGLVSQYFDHIELKKQNREFITHTGYIGQQRISVVSTGIGEDNIDIVLNELDALVNIDFNTRTIKDHLTSLRIIRLGTCGCLEAEIPVGSLIISDYALSFSPFISFYQRPYTKRESELYRSVGDYFKHLPQSSMLFVAEGDPELRNHLQALGYGGLTFTCGGFYGPQYRHLRAPLIKQDVLGYAQGFVYNDLRISNFEMETAAIYALGSLLGHRCCSISVAVANRISNIFVRNSQESIQNMIYQVINHMFR